MRISKYLWMMIFALGIGLLTGVCCYLFSYALNIVTVFRKNYGILPFLLLPFVGFLVAKFYEVYGQEEDRGNNLILDEIHRPRKKIRARLVPLIFSSALISHLFGASVGREGVGVQMGAGIADQFPHQLFDRKILLMMGMSAGFAAIFSTPLAGAVFGVEVLMIGSFPGFAIVPCFASALSGFYTAKYLGARTGHLYELPHFDLNFLLFFTVIFLGIYFGLIARLFSFCIHYTKQIFQKKIKSKPSQSLIGGIILLFLFIGVGSDRYLGLSEELVKDSFNGTAKHFDFIAKIFSTSISVGSGFKGGEVMPLFIVGATSGHFISQFLPVAKNLVVALGFVCVFAGAANVPLTSIFLAVELFGLEIAPLAFIAVMMSFFFSGKIGIYSSQKKKLKRFYFRSHIRKTLN